MEKYIWWVSFGLFILLVGGQYVLLPRFWNSSEEAKTKIRISFRGFFSAKLPEIVSPVVVDLRPRVEVLPEGEDAEVAGHGGAGGLFKFQIYNLFNFPYCTPKKITLLTFSPMQ